VIETSGKDLEKDRTFLVPQCFDSFLCPAQHNFHANACRMLVKEGATDLLDRMKFLRNRVPDHPRLNDNVESPSKDPPGITCRLS
jgi:hypothetical protein